MSRLALWLLAASLWALAHLVAHLREHPEDEYPARQSGAVCLAVEEAAAKRGWTPPMEET